MCDLVKIYIVVMNVRDKIIVLMILYFILILLCFNMKKSFSISYPYFDNIISLLCFEFRISNNSSSLISGYLFWTSSNMAFILCR